MFSKPHLSASSLNTYLDCGLQYKFAKIDKVQPEFTPDALVFGTVIHAVLADFYQELMIGNTLEAQELESMFETYWREKAFENENIRYKRGKNYNFLLQEGKALLSAFRNEYTLMLGSS